MSTESHKHRLAKELLADWLLSAKVDPWLSFHADRVYVEYPLIEGNGNGIQMAWDEVPKPNGDGCYQTPPTYDELCAFGTPPSAILDVAVIRDGCLRYGFEIVHKSPVTPKKIKRLHRCSDESPMGLDIWAIPADWILGQIGVPERFVGEHIISPLDDDKFYFERNSSRKFRLRRIFAKEYLGEPLPTPEAGYTWATFVCVLEPGFRIKEPVTVPTGFVSVDTPDWLLLAIAQRDRSKQFVTLPDHPDALSYYESVGASLYGVRNDHP